MTRLLGNIIPAHTCPGGCGVAGSHSQDQGGMSARETRTALAPGRAALLLETWHWRDPHCREEPGNSLDGLTLGNSLAQLVTDPSSPVQSRISGSEEMAVWWREGEGEANLNIILC